MNISSVTLVRSCRVGSFARGICVFHYLIGLYTAGARVVFVTGVFVFTVIVLFLSVAVCLLLVGSHALLCGNLLHRLLISAARRTLLPVAALCRHTTRTCAQALELIDCLGDERVRKGQLWRQSIVSLPLNAFLKIKRGLRKIFLHR